MNSQSLGSRSPMRCLSAYVVALLGVAVVHAEDARQAADTHWAFRPIARPTIPADTGWSDHPIDRFIAAKWQQQGLHPAPVAERRVLLRRLSFDLIGLPPTPDETSAFLADESPNAWCRLIERLLNSPHYGERWGRHWMDVARYADTAGDNADYPVPEARLYRDYIIDAFNADKPYDQFVREQIAGDLLAAASLRNGGSDARFAEQTIATGFLALSRRYATAPYELWHLTLEDTIDTVGRAFLGLTFKCARCHDHKFDPVTQDDYYALYGIFASTQFPWAGGEEFHSKQFGRMHFAALPTPEQLAATLRDHTIAVASLEAKLKEPDLPANEVTALKAQLRDRLRTGVPAGVPCAYAVREGTPADVALQRGGDPAQPGAVVPRRMPLFASLPMEAIPAGQSGRLQLAQWLTHPQNPLTARVLVNRIWQHHFGTGLVTTPSNFGTRGEPPSHPELLDFLAGDFIDRGWSVKATHRLILTSKTWQLASADATHDPANRFYARFERQRLDAECIRDAVLSVSGALNLDRPGEHPFPDMKAWTWTQHTPFKDIYATPHRSVYLMTQRLQRHPFLALFDGPDTNTTTDQRSSSIVPLQALFWRNSAMVQEQAGNFADRLLRAAADERARIRLGFELAYTREPMASETERYLKFAHECEAVLQRDGTPAHEIPRAAWASVARVILASNEFVYVE